MRARRNRKQVLLFLIAVIFPSLVLVALTLRMMSQERELAEKRWADERRRLASEIGQQLLVRLEKIKLQEVSVLERQAPQRRGRTYLNPEVVLVGGGDGGKTWIVDDQPRGKTVDVAKATEVAVRELAQAMHPGAKVSQLQAKIRRVYRGFGINPDSVHIYFHGLGLSHSDLEQYVEEGKPYPDWALEENMVVATHLLYPGGDRDRYWVEDVVVVRSDGGESLYTWDFAPITGRGS